MVTKFVTHFNYEMPTGEEPVDETIVVERAGYVPAKKQIEALIYSGQRLIEWRMDEFGGKNVEEAENDYLGIDSCLDFTDIDSVLSEYQQRAAHVDADPNHDNGKHSDSESVSVTEEQPGEV